MPSASSVARAVCNCVFVPGLSALYAPSRVTPASAAIFAIFSARAAVFIAALRCSASPDCAANERYAAIDSLVSRYLAESTSLTTSTSYCLRDWRVRNANSCLQAIHALPCPRPWGVAYFRNGSSRINILDVSTSWCGSLLVGKTIGMFTRRSGRATCLVSCPIGKLS